MKLSDLVKLRNNLQDISFSGLIHQIELLDASLSKNLLFSLHDNYKNEIENLINFLDTVECNNANQQQNLINLITTIEKEIEEITVPMLKLGYKINDFYGSNLTNFDVERLDRLMYLTDDERGEIGTVVRSYTDWHYPALEIGPGDGEWTESLVAADPLYIVDRHQAFLDSTLDKFNEVYRRRVRPYLTGIHADRPEFDYTMLPQEQFGFIFAWNVINFWPFEETRHALKQCYDLLRPGGSMMFSFNNCDIVQCAEYAESGYKSYLTPKLLDKIFAEIGFKIKQYRSTSINVHWVEIHKPGILTTSKRHQTLGRIFSVEIEQEVDTQKEKIYNDSNQDVDTQKEKIYNDSNQDVDTQKEKIYNDPKFYSKEEIAQLKRQALYLKIDTADRIYKSYSPEQLEQLINQKRNNQ